MSHFMKNQNIAKKDVFWKWNQTKFKYVQSVGFLSAVL